MHGTPVRMRDFSTHTWGKAKIGRVVLDYGPKGNKIAIDRLRVRHV